MAAKMETAKLPRDRITMQDLLGTLTGQKANILDNIQKIPQPIKDQIDIFQKELQQITQTAESAFETTLANHEDIQKLQQPKSWAREENIVKKYKRLKFQTA